MMPFKSIEAYGSLEIKSLRKNYSLVNIQDTKFKNIEESEQSKAYISPIDTYYKSGEVPTATVLYSH